MYLMRFVPRKLVKTDIMQCERLGRREWIYVDGYCNAIALIVHKDWIGEAYSVGEHNEMVNIVLTHLIKKIG